MSFEPIAIVGRGCVLPGALSPEALWEAVAAGRDLLSSAPEGAWRVSPRHIMSDGEAQEGRTGSDRGGYVQGFEAAFDPSGFHMPREEVERADPLLKWCLHAGRQALEGVQRPDPTRAGLILGNLSYPSAHMAAFAERCWLGDELADAAGVPTAGPEARFMSGLPAHRVARALGLGGTAWALDAACASSLYALKAACEALQDRRSDLMLAGAVSCADDLFLHVGFSALQALSKRGMSRPFHGEADGLVPAQGAGLVALKRLRDAEEAGDRVWGIMRGIGLSNDGRAKGFLAPSSARQVVAMERAYRSAGLRPKDISLVECHATGTVVGDGAEIRSMCEIFAGAKDVPVGSLKSNLGHLITTAGIAGLLKVLGAMEHRIRPPTLHTDHPHEALADSPLRLLKEAEAWDTQGPLRAAVSAFGFGGNNAHLIVEEHQPVTKPAAALPASNTAVAIVGMGCHLGEQRGVAAFEAVLFGPETAVSGRATEVALGLEGLRFPPNDLAQTLPQQLLLLEAARDAVRSLASAHGLPKENTGAFVGMGCDPNIARHGARWRMPEWCEAWGIEDPSWCERAQDAFIEGLGPAGVVGAMPNIVANRLNSQLDLGGASMAISSEELSGVRALEIAARALRDGELDAALVGAVDLSCDPVHEAALEALQGNAAQGADGAVVLVLKRLEDAISHGDRVMAVLDPELQAPFPQDPDPVAARWGHCHGASGLLQVAAAALLCARGRRPGGELWAGPRAISLELEALGGQRAHVGLKSLGGGRLPPACANPGPGAGAVLRYPAHLEAPTLPPSGAGPRQHMSPSAGEAPQFMAPAPTLPPALASWPGRERVAAPELERQSSPGAPLAEAQGAFHAVHHRHLAEMQASHERFLAHQQRASRLLLAAAGGMPAPEPVAATPPASAPGPLQAVPLAGQPVGRRFSREELEIHASGAISQLFGPLFEQQDGHRLQVRMPEPPLLLADRVVGLDGEPGTLGKGTIWTETDVLPESWYLHDGRMPAGIMIESGQADLMLISYLGIDFLNRGERAYRLLGCELSYHGGLPRPGDTLRYDIHVDGHASHGDVRLFFFHYDCQVDGAPRLKVRGGQAGFFTADELEESMGILWTPEEGERAERPRLDPPVVQRVPGRLGRAQLEAFAAGDAHTCFGAGFERAQTHTRSPRIAEGKMLLLQEVSHLERSGGPWGRGYLRATWDFQPDDWFFEGHFKGDPCMPGTLMFEGCLQGMALYMAGLGFTLDRDGWVFEPERDLAYALRCRGQATPESEQLVYEVFVDEVADGPTPTLYADLLCTVDGRKAFHCRRMALQLCPGWPLDSRRHLLEASSSTLPVAEVGGFTFDYAALLASAWGRPSEAFGPMYAPFDGPKRVARLPGPPYHFMSRVTRVDGLMGEMVPGAEVTLEYDIPPDAWYFQATGAATMPFCVLLEAALQPCGWLASYVGSALTQEAELFFRNLGGTGTLHEEIGPDAGTLLTRVKLTKVSSSGGMIIQGFGVQCSLGDRVVYDLETVFGFFPLAALQNQKGLPVSEAQARFLEGPAPERLDLGGRPEAYFGGPARLPHGKLLMLDRLSGWWPDGGAAGLGRLRAEVDVDPGAWFFKAHFFQDPVQPGSLGLEAMVQLLQLAMLKLGMDEGMHAPRFEPIALEQPMSWSYRGQVVPEDDRVTVTMELTERGQGDRGPWLRANASLWVDGRRIYEAEGLGMRLVEGGAA